MPNLIYHVEDRGHKYIFHWFTYMIAGLRHLEKMTTTSGRDGGGSFERNIEKYRPEYTSKINITFSYIDDFLDYQSQTFDILKNYHVISKNDINNDDIVINNYGEKICDNPYHIDKEGYEFLRTLFLSSIDDQNKDYLDKNLFISRSKSHLQQGNSGAKRRQIINEKDLEGHLSKMNIETIFLEDLDLRQKISIFKNAKNIISPNSGGLIFSLACNSKQKLIEINSRSPHQINHQYKTQCDFTGMRYEKYSVEDYDAHDNMTINISEFLNFLEKHL